jgi:hypothetical protein
MKILIPLSLVILLAACGVADTAGSAATTAAAEVEQVRRARAIEAQLKQELEQAAKRQEERMQEAEGR